MPTYGFCFSTFMSGCCTGNLKSLEKFERFRVRCVTLSHTQSQQNAHTCIWPQKAKDFKGISEMPIMLPFVTPSAISLSSFVSLWLHFHLAVK